ncbi:MAG: adaptor protein MecA [Ruminococcus sp.]|nr:adaptor protein MecA [Ruminococcus sp.]
MKVEKMGQETVKVTVSHSELAEYNIEPGTINGDNINTHMFFVNVFSEIKRKFAVELKGMHLYLEVFTIMEDTTIIYISLMNEPEDLDEEKYTYIYFSDRLEELAAAAGEICTMQPDISFESKFYISDEGYFLVIKSEFAVFRTNHAIGSGDYCAEYIEEHFRVIEEENAVGKLAKLLS